MRRHFVERNDSETCVLTNQPFSSPEVSSYCVIRPDWLERAMRTRFRRLIRQLEMVFLGRLMLPKALRIAREFKPDVVFTIPDNDVSWCAYLTAKRLKLPLVSNFQDWWPNNLYWSESERPFPLIRRLLDWRFRRIYSASKLAFCTSDGMKEYLGPHRDAVTLLPCPGRIPSTVPLTNLRPVSKPLRVLYTGTITGSYGRSILTLSRRLADLVEFEFLVYGPPPDWNETDVAWAKAKGIYKGFVPPVELHPVLASADIFLTVMSFDRSLELMSRVSFTTKFLEYAQYGRPIVVWGPSYCQPVLVAKKTAAGLAVESSDPAAVVSALEQLMAQSEYNRYAAGAIQAAETFFSPDRIHEIFKTSLLRVIEAPEHASMAC